MATSYEAVIAQARQERACPLVSVERRGPSATVTLDDPERLNPLSAPLTLELHDHLRELAGDDALRTIVLTGRDPAFSAGGDLKLIAQTGQELLSQSPGGATDVWRWIRHQFGGIARLITRSDKAFIAAVNGPAAGVGLAFALACDVILLSERARVVPAFGRIGLIPEVGTSWQLTRRLGYQRTFAMFMSGRHLSGAEAYELGLGNELVAHADLLSVAAGWCDRIERQPAHVVQMSKCLLRQCADMSWEQTVTMEEFAEPMCFTTQAHQQAVTELLTSGSAGEKDNPRP